MHIRTHVHVHSSITERVLSSAYAGVEHTKKVVNITNALLAKEHQFGAYLTENSYSLERI